jgi:NAD(P)-dependent dehydrogenase (short-subunit alcohol dehydrogenase family)
MSVVLVTGASSGIGNSIARAVAVAGHTVYATMRDLGGHNAPQAHAVADFASNHNVDMRALDLDVTSQDSADVAVSQIIDEADHLDVVVHNAGHLVIGFAEAFSADEIAHLFDVNVLGQHRVNRSALPYLRAAGTGYLIYVGSTTTPARPPFMAPYVTSKVAGEALAETTAYELRPFGIETSIVLPGALTAGTNHFPNASRPADKARTEDYGRLEPLMRTALAGATTSNPEGAVPASPAAVGDEVVRLLGLPYGSRPLHSLVDYQRSGLDRVLNRQEEVTAEVLKTFGMSQLLTIAAAVDALS